ncbi:Cell wall-associated hydrolase, NlpC family [Lentzea albidocapillata subsp. violacea]|uniref:Cell wall-associated hydrolase, NlpC family n=1 Tax=Lentzea albidocapillata subsp. violacea TaxID=128104 RepID=A0A1G9S2P5_9PSEU|nr:C40 family peptidase [Lentzea albidocapillata]SDM29741.1 Cell wall-associated hydrolase, NlpC family [Lentzea albidocapillata subsp. violacea]
MVSHRNKRISRTILTGAVLATAVAPTMAASAQPADPDPLARYNELSAHAAKTNEDLLKARGDLKAKREQLARSTVAEQQAREEEERFRGQVDALTTATFEGARFNQLSALLVSESQQDFLNRMSALNMLATDNNEALQRLGLAVAKADHARQSAQEAANAAAKLVGEVEQRQRDLDGQIKEVRAALGSLDPSVRNDLKRVKDTGSYVGPPGSANAALQAALSKRGAAYEWGAEGPSAFDCSGLTMWAYQQAGIQLPRVASAQYDVGMAVPLNALLPGDLLFYDDGTGNPAAIHHVAMYVGDDKMVDAPTQGQVVDLRPSRGDGHLMGARRIAG